MSNLLFVHDHKFVVTPQGIYSSGAFPSWAWDRYLCAFSKVTVVARAREELEQPVDSRLDYSERQDVSFHFLPSISNLRSLFMQGGTAAEQLHMLVASHDAVIVRLSSELGLLAVKYAKELGKKLAVELVDCPWDSYWNYGSLKAKLYAPFVTFRVRSAVKKADAVLYVTREFLQKRYPCSKNALTIACSNVNLLDVDEEILKKRLVNIENRRMQANAFPIIGQISSLTGRFKGIQVMLEALPSLIREYPGLKYKILGPGDSTYFIDKAKSLGVLEHVEFCGTVPSGAPVAEWLDNIDLYVHPSLKEGLPRAVIEAMARGCPVVASSVAGTPELLPAEVLATPGRGRELLERISYVLSDRCDRRKLSIDNFNKAKEYSGLLLKERRIMFWKQFSGIVDEGSVSR